ncbi:MAG: pentapeptide repeat-containing protein [Gallionellaceae bacterium]
MFKVIFNLVSFALLAVVFAKAATAEDAATCAEWKSTVAVNVDKLDSLKKSAASDRPTNGYSYTKNQFIVLLGKNLVAAKDALANSKDKLPKTSEGKIDLKDALLNGFDLRGLNLDNVDLKGAEMNGADLSGSTLREASLYKAELEGANLNNTNLSFANLAKAKLSNASLCHATLTAADLEDSIMVGAYLKNAKLDMAKKIPKAVYLNAQTVLQFGLPVPEN